MITNWINQSTRLVTWLDEECVLKVVAALDSHASWEAGTADLFKVVAANASLVRYTPDLISEVGSGAYYCERIVPVPEAFSVRIPVFLRPCLKSALFRVKKLDSSEPEPMVTVVIATYNREQECARAVESVLQQSYRNIRCLVVRDAPGDYRLPQDPRVEFHALPRRSKYPAGQAQMWHIAGLFPFNYANALTAGPIMCLLDDDDIFLPDHVSTIVDEWQRSKAHVIYTEPYTADGRKPFDFAFDAARLEQENFIFSCNTAYCGAALAVSHTPPYAESPGDWTTLKRMAECGLVFRKVPRVTSVHGDERLTRERKAYVQKLWEQHRLNNPDLPSTPGPKRSG